ARSCEDKEFEEFNNVIVDAANKLSKTRPTAVDLFNSIQRILKIIDKNESVKENIANIEKEAENLRLETIEECRLIGEHGNQLIKSDYRIMTICNAGALATVDIGTALAPIRKAHSDGKKIIVYVNETRPRMQGARLTAWELYHEDIEHYIITDNSAGHIIKNGLIDLAIVGADRIVLNGDVANKIGTYTLSVLCKENEIPFYVAAPISTFDTTSKSGNDITIEERDGKEVRTALSVNDKQDTKPKRRIIHHSLSPNLNPAFDVTPSKNITGIITPKGILEHPLEKSITKLLEKSK
ncbi:MAG: S-methyl-5-thioribose-1-phosphate isomerase, partial [Candidatus Heimdallarchaeota archaeon]|nr:S-methyl-5-thioribose-1-phosphate isomerase [Candidatus Heimdallarchaeota archaeon]